MEFELKGLVPRKTIDVLKGDKLWIQAVVKMAGVGLWLFASLGLRLYLHFFNRYSATYGPLGAVIILMLWLYMTGFAILIGGEVNWLIESEDKKTAAFELKKQTVQQQLRSHSVAGWMEAR